MFAEDDVFSNEMFNMLKENVIKSNLHEEIFSNPAIKAIENDFSVALNLSLEEKELHKENADLYQMLVDNRKLYDETISTIDGKHDLNKISGFKDKYLEVNKDIVNQIEINNDKLKDLKLDNQLENQLNNKLER